MKLCSMRVQAGGQNKFDDPINYGTFSFQKYKEPQLYQHIKWGGADLPMMPEGYWMGCH